jgi:hypothetical protein
MIPASLNTLGDCIIVGAVLAIVAVPLVLLHLAVRQARRALRGDR